MKVRISFHLGYFLFVLTLNAIAMSSASREGVPNLGYMYP